MSVAALRREDKVRGAHDAEFEREPHGGDGVPGADVFRGVDEVDGVPPGALDDGEVGLRGVRWESRDGDLELDIPDAHVLYASTEVKLETAMSEGKESGGRLLTAFGSWVLVVVSKLGGRS
jgi:hypothetical protein